VADDRPRRGAGHYAETSKNGDMLSELTRLYKR
jgi:hypothetical protein